ncbi:MAG: SIS domain-containing protein [Acidimicrobiales bacterium]
MTTKFEREIRSQGEILRGRVDHGMRQARSVSESWGAINYALVAARGSSDNAAVFFQYLAGQELGLLVALAAPSLFESESPIGLRGAGVLGISQSGKTPGLVRVMEQANAQHCPTSAITNDTQSPLAHVSNQLIDIAAGQEEAIASTKTFSSTWHALVQLVSTLKGSTLEGLSELPDVVDRTTSWALEASLPTSLLNVDGGLTVVGRGIGQAVASEIALKIREVAGLRCEAYPAADYLHGPIGAAGEGSTLLVVITDEMSDRVGGELLRESERFGMKTVVLRPPGREAFSGDGEIVLREQTANVNVGLAEVIVGQVLALRIGELRQRPIDSSPGLNKITLSA